MIPYVKIFDTLSTDNIQYIYAYLEFYELQNIKLVCKNMVSDTTFKTSLQTFIKTYNIILNPSYEYCLQIFYIRKPYIWDYINVCTHKLVYMYKRYGYNKLFTNNIQLHFTKFYIKTIMYDKYKQQIIAKTNTSANLYLYNKYKKLFIAKSN